MGCGDDGLMTSETGAVRFLPGPLVRAVSVKLGEEKGERGKEKREREVASPPPAYVSCSLMASHVFLSLPVYLFSCQLHEKLLTLLLELRGLCGFLWSLSLSPKTGGESTENPVLFCQCERLFAEQLLWALAALPGASLISPSSR